MSGRRNCIGFTDESILSGNSSSQSMLEVLLDELEGEGFFETLGIDGKGLVAPSVVYNAFTEGRPKSRLFFERFMEVIAEPGCTPMQPIRTGDLIVRIGLAEPGLGHLAVITNEELMSLDDLKAQGITPECHLPGLYAIVNDRGARPQSSTQHFARLVTDETGHMPYDQMILRIKQSTLHGAEQADESPIPETPFPQEEIPNPVVTLPSDRPRRRRYMSSEENIETDLFPEGDLTTNFSLSEFSSRGTPVPEQYLANVRQLAENLQVLRDNIGRSITITSGYRTPEHNASVGGASKSQHLTASAADIRVNGLSPNQVYCAIEEIIGQGAMRQGGLGIYTSFVHYDIRGRSARWAGRGALAPDCQAVSSPRPQVALPQPALQYITHAGPYRLAYDQLTTLGVIEPLPGRNTRRFRGTSALQTALNNWAPYIERVMSPPMYILTGGLYVDKPGEHGKGNAIDTDGFWWSDTDKFLANDARTDWVRYLTIEATLRKVFGTVLNYDYNSAHHDHWHCDLGTPTRWRAVRSQVNFAQRALKEIWGENLEVDGKWGNLSKTAAARYGYDFSVVGEWDRFLDDILNRRATPAAPSIPLQGAMGTAKPEDEKELEDLEIKIKPPLNWVKVPADVYQKGYSFFRIRSDLENSYRAMYREIKVFGGIIASSGGFRDLSAEVTTGRSKTSLHYLGRAIDLYTHAGMQSENDPYIVIQDGEKDGKPRWKVFCISSSPITNDPLYNASLIKEEEIECLIWTKGSGFKKIKRVTRYFCLTDIMAKYGWKRISARKCWKENYRCVEWWHFQNESGLEIDKTTFGEELLKIWPKELVEKSGLSLSAVWKGGYFGEKSKISGIGKQPTFTAPITTQSISSLPLPIQMALRAGNLTLEVALAILGGNRDVNDLTNRVFYALYPKWRDKKLKRDDPEAKVWIRIRDVIRNLLGKVTMGPVSSASPPSATLMSEDDKLFKWHPPTEERRYGGYSRYGGGRVDKRLKELSVSGQVLISDADIDMLQRIANVESRGMIQCINSYDSAFMSMGFMQWTIKYNDKYSPDGKLQRLIQRAPKAFRRYGIELVGPRRYHIKTKSGTYTPLAIKGAEKPSDLRSLEWAKRFYAAGLDPDIIVEEVNLALEVIKEDKKRIIDRVGSTFLPHYEKSAILRALIQETFNNRPAYLYLALQRAIARAKKIDEINTDQFLELTRKTIKEVYTEKEPKKGPKKAENLINKTERLTL